MFRWFAPAAWSVPLQDVCWRFHGHFLNTGKPGLVFLFGGIPGELGEVMPGIRRYLKYRHGNVHRAVDWFEHPLPNRICGSHLDN